MPQFTISLDAESVKRTLSKKMAAVKDWTPAFDRAGSEMLTEYGYQTFEEQGPPGEAWRELSPATLKARLNRWGYYRNEPVASGKKLVWTGRLRAGFRKEVAPLMLRIHNVVDYFQYHQRGEGNVPKRRMLYLSQERVYALLREMYKQLRDAV